MSSSLSGSGSGSGYGSGRQNQTLYDLADNYTRAIRTHSEVLSVLKLALSKKGSSTVVSAGFVREVIDEAYKNTLYSFKYLRIAFNEYYNAMTINPGIDNS